MAARVVRVLPGLFTIARLPVNGPVPKWVEGPGLVSLTRTAEELSILCPSDRVPPGPTQQAGWRAIRVAGTLDFGLVGVLAELLRPLAEAKVPVFVLSTFDTDYLLVDATRLDSALAALTEAGNSVER